MDLERFCVLLGIPYTDNFSELSRAFRQYARAQHPDVGGDLDKWNQISQLHVQAKKLHSEGKPLRQQNSYEQQTPYRNKTQDREKKPPQSSTPKSNAAKGDDLYIRPKVDINLLISGGVISINLPKDSFRESSEANMSQIKVTIEPNPLVINQDGSISKRYLNSLFSSKKIVRGRGKRSNDGGRPGNLIISFEIDTSNFDYFAHIPTWNVFEGEYQSRFSESSTSSADSGVRSKSNSKVAVIFLLVCFGLGMMIHNNNVKREQEAIAFELCGYVDNTHYSIADDYFYGSPRPWLEALQSGFFAPDPNAPDQTGYQGHAVELPSYYLDLSYQISAKEFLQLQRLIYQFTTKIEEFDVSYAKYLKAAKNECRYLENAIFYND